MIESNENEHLHQQSLQEADHEGLDLSALDEDYDYEDEGHAPDFDYDRIIDGVTDRIARAALAAHHQHTARDPYADVASMIHENPIEAIQRTVDLATRNAVEAMMPYVAPIRRNQALAQVTEGLNEEGQQFVHAFLNEKGIDPALLSDPTVADLVRSKAELHQLRRTGQSGERQIPGTETARGYPGMNIDADSKRELGGIERLYRSLGVDFDPSRLIGRMKS